MKHRDYVEQQRQDPEYLKAEAEVRPALELAEDIIRLRVERGWSQKELAKKLGTWQANVSRLEHGQANPTLETLRKLSEVFEVDLVVRLSEPQQVLERETQQEQATDWIFSLPSVAVSPTSNTQIYRGVAVFCPDLQQPRISA